MPEVLVDKFFFFFLDVGIFVPQLGVLYVVV